MNTSLPAAASSDAPAPADLSPPVPEPLTVWDCTASLEGHENGRLVQRKGRAGWLGRTPLDCLRLPDHPINKPRGSLTVWLLPLEDLSTMQRLPQHHKHLPHSGRYRILSDRADRDLTAAHFALAWDNWWHPNLIAKFAEGFEPWEIHNEPSRAFVGAGHFTFRRDHWHCVGLSWDHEADRYLLYVNGFLVGTSDSFVRDFGGSFFREDAGPDLFAGNSAIAISEVAAWSEPLDRETFRRIYQAGSGSGQIDPGLDDGLSALYGPAPAPVPLAFEPGSDWAERFAAPLADPAELERFYIQGNSPAVKIEDGRMVVRTGGGPIPNHATFAEQQLYIWPEAFFEGDLYVEFDFMPLAHGGLSLLMLQASGMQREDFMACYPRRTTGSMSMVCWEDVRNYHWEYFREMNDVRNDRISHGLVKNPWYHAMGYATRSGRYALNEWHRVQYLQEGARLRGIVDGDNVLDVTDNPFSNNGPVLQAGRLAIRVMARSQIAFRNLRVFNRSVG